MAVHEHDRVRVLLEHLCVLTPCTADWLGWCLECLQAVGGGVDIGCQLAQQQLADAQLPRHDTHTDYQQQGADAGVGGVVEVVQAAQSRSSR